MEEIIVRYIHFVGIMMLSSALVAEHLLLAKELSFSQLKRLIIIDRIYGVSALVVLSAGLTLWLGVGKPAAFYSANFIFHIKMTLFFVIAGISLIPTLFFIRQSKILNNDEVQAIVVPKKIILFIRLQLVALLLMPFLGSLIARGFGLS